ncbi:unnamed protein product [Paramecium sonneborni]|uniref:Uncharacterized protein n=1 Tax=Paramecium sonneborni TaxID=65129 RepID=A0A8S1PV80_9CILI|nr:unnamed protein product [Paramecium sonneborni]
MNNQYNKRGNYRPRQEVYEYVTKEEYEQQQIEQKQEQQQKQYNPQKKQQQHFQKNKYDNEKREQQQQQQNQNKHNDYKQYQKQNNQKDNKNYQKRFQSNVEQDNDYRRDEPQQEEETQKFDITKVKQKELTQTLIKMLKQRKIECPVCYDKIHPQQKIWSCSQCYSPFHLYCMHKWIKNLNPKNVNELFSWSCPKCNLLIQDKLPEYTCFCGKQKDPEADSYSVPHSCSQKCQKKRGQYCPHPCPMDCHPGPCPECHVQGVELKCFCGKKTKQMQCSEIKKDFSCGQSCGKMLNCNKHICQKQCHNGNCQPCIEIHEVQCYCGNEKNSINCAQSSYSCGKICGKILDCGQHQCLEQCHPKCQPCKLKPELIIFCACGKYKINDLIKEQRKSCLDPIPNCGTPIETTLNCGHKSRTICGSDYPECTQKVKEKCRCGDSTRVKVCNDKSLFVCDDVCKKRKSCGVHFCQKECCPPGDQESHLCLKVCNKPLPCGQHNCDQFCHIGACQPCPIIINQPLFCPCGKSVKNPPMKCGTAPPSCLEVCNKILECGHSCKSLCHPGPCPNCMEQIEKFCRCKENKLSTICSKQAVCRNYCNKLLNCGHKCQEICQAQEQCPGNGSEGCGQKCNIKKLCNHLCQEICHPNLPCPKEPCKIQIRIVCTCGNRDTFTECGVVDELIEKTLKCDQKCQNIKRFGAFYKSNSLVDIEKTYYPDILLKYTHYNLQNLQKMEEKIEHFLVHSKPEEGYDFSFPRSEWSELKKVALQTLFSRHYKFDVQILKTQNKQYLFSLYKTQDTCIPKIKLSEYFIKVQKGIIKRDHQPFKAKIKTFYEVSSSDAINIENALSDFKGDFYSERQSQQFVLNFWEEAQAEFALKKLKKVVGLLNINWVLEMNQQCLDEYKRIFDPAQENDIIVKPKKVKQYEYEEQTLEIQYSKLEEENFIKLQKQYSDKAKLTQKCDDEEIEERINNMQLSIFEQDGFYQYEIQPIKEKIIRSFKQEQKPFVPEYVRTPDTLCKTIDFILSNFLKADEPDSDFKKPMKGDIPRDIIYEDIYEFINDRFKQIIVELNYLQYQNDNIYGIIIIQYLVKIIRFYVISHSQLSDNQENLKTLCELLKKIKNDETLQYTLILSCFQQIPECSEFYSQMIEIKEQENLSPIIQSLIALATQVQSKLYHKYIDFYQKQDNLLIKSLMHGFLNQIIIQINEQFQQIASSLEQDQTFISVTKLLEQLQIEEQNNLIEYLNQLGLNDLQFKVSESDSEVQEINFSQILQQLQKKKPYEILDLDRLTVIM